MLATPESRALDIEVAEKVMGFKRWVAATENAYFFETEESLKPRVVPSVWAEGFFRIADDSSPAFADAARYVPCYSTDIAAAWDLFTKFHMTVSDMGENGFTAHPSRHRVGLYHSKQDISATAETGPKAIALAALKAEAARVPA
jgi:hypothetical protein